MDFKREGQVAFLSMDKERLLNIKEAADFLGKTEEEIKQLVKAEEIIAYQIGGMYLRFKLENLQNYKYGSHSQNTRTNLNTKDNCSRHKESPALDYIKDLFYFNDFYMLAILVIAVLLFIIIRNIS
ncbi:MAG: helix-turn-helix domain-containing protein [Candidatus Omnitrophota bacterium]